MAKKREKSDFNLAMGNSFESKSSEMRESFFKEQSTPSDSGKDRFRNLVSTIAGSFLFKTKKSVAVVTAAVTLLVTLSFTSLFAPNPMDTTTLAARISGGVALNESQLKDVVRQIKQKVDAFTSTFSIADHQGVITAYLSAQPLDQCSSLASSLSDVLSRVLEAQDCR